MPLIMTVVTLVALGVTVLVLREQRRARDLLVAVPADRGVASVHELGDVEGLPRALVGFDPGAVRGRVALLQHAYEDLADRCDPDTVADAWRRTRSRVDGTGPDAPPPGVTDTPDHDAPTGEDVPAPPVAPDSDPADARRGSVE